MYTMSYYDCVFGICSVFSISVSGFSIFISGRICVFVFVSLQIKMVKTNTMKKLVWIINPAIEGRGCVSVEMIVFIFNFRNTELDTLYADGKEQSKNKIPISIDIINFDLKLELVEFMMCVNADLIGCCYFLYLLVIKYRYWTMGFACR